MRRRTLIAAFLALVAVCASAQSYRMSFPEGLRFVLPAANAAPLLLQCSRPAPQGATSYWEPSEAEIVELERALVEYLDQLTGAERPPLGLTYHRQYIGFARNGIKLIYGNFYPGTEEVAEFENIRAALVCDGGPSRWGVTYDPATRNFSGLAFNGLT
jgi:hypothetical protein